MIVSERAALVLRMVSTLPGYGSWADSFRDFDTPYGNVGYRQLSILWALRYRLIPDDEFSPTRLAAFFRVQPSVATRSLAKLEAVGFISRAVDASDGESPGSRSRRRAGTSASTSSDSTSTMYWTACPA